MENELIAMSGFIRLSTVLTVLEKNLERAKTYRVPSMNLKNSEVFMVHVLNGVPEGLSAEEVSHICKLDRSLISRNARSLIEKGLIVRPGRMHGKRSYGAKLILTEKGRQVGDIIQKYVHNVQTFLDEGIPEEDLEVMYRTLNRLCDRFEEMNNMTHDKLVKAGLYVSE
ncbi:MAG: winged helix-turn-helix transcriptional regulator [Christensenellaceae bacterium]|nr:winged helix-turn-helix transcriptional regulator [Christensenellaceae bacterium]